MESEGPQMKQCWISYIKNERLLNSSHWKGPAKKVFAGQETHAENHNTSYLWASRYQTNLWTRNGLLTANNSAHPGPSPPPTRSPAPSTPPTPPSTKFDHYTDKKRRVHGLAEKASRNMAILSMYGFPPLCHRLSVSTNSTVISIIYLPRVLCLSFVLSYSFLSSWLSSCHSCGTLSYSLC